jgi:hypothetical protein
MAMMARAGQEDKGAQAKAKGERQGKASPLSTSNKLRALFTLPFRLLDLGKRVQIHKVVTLLNCTH